MKLQMPQMPLKGLDIPEEEESKEISKVEFTKTLEEMLNFAYGEIETAFNEIKECSDHISRVSYFVALMGSGQYFLMLASMLAETKIRDPKNTAFLITSEGRLYTKNKTPSVFTETKHPEKEPGQYL